MTRSPDGTRANRVFEQLRSDILTGRLQPGERLKFPELATRYTAGVGATREALARLVEQGLVRSEPHIGFRVVPLSVDDLHALTDARIELEGLVFRRSIEAGDLAWQSRVVATHYALQHTPQKDADDPERVSDAWLEAHADFHRALLEGCTNTRLLDIALEMRDAATVYQAWSQQQRTRSGRSVVKEHKTLMELALARDPDAAVAALAQHISRTTDVLLGRLAAAV